MSRSIHRPLLVVLLALLAGACNAEDPFFFPTEPTPTPVTEVFSGTLTVNGAVTHPYASMSSGTTTATLTALGPDSGDTVGLGLGTYTAGVCEVRLANDLAVQSSVVTGVVGGIGALCVRIYDVGQLAGPVAYEIEVFHP